MSSELKVTEVGGSLAVIIPAALADELQIQEGDSLFVSKSATSAGGPYSSEKIRRQMEIAERVMRENRNLLHRLAQ